MTRATLLILTGLLAGYASHYALNWGSDQAREHETPHPDPTPLRDRVAESLAGAAAGQAHVAASEQPTAEFGAITEFDTSFCGKHRISFRGPEDVA